MRKLLLVVVVILAAAGGGTLYYVRAHSQPAYVRPDLASILNEVSRNDLGTRTSNPSAALNKLSQAEKGDPGNALTHYLVAAAYARQRNWTSVDRELTAGNAAPRAVYYVADPDVAPVYPAYITLRQLARDCAAGARAHPSAAGLELLRHLRAAAKRVAGLEPPGVIAVLVGASLRSIADRALVDTAVRLHRESDIDSARSMQEADNRWAGALRKDVKAMTASMDPEALVRRYFTDAEWHATQNGTIGAPELRAKLHAFRRDVEAAEQPVVARNLATMPD